MNLTPTLKLNENYNIVESVHFDLAHIKDATAEKICGAYIANLLAALVLIRAKDPMVARILKDTTGSTLNGYNQSMNPVNIWGLAIRKPESKEFKDYLSADVAKELDRINGRILKGTFTEIHRPLSTHPNMIVWEDMIEATKLMLMRLNLKNYKTTIVTNTIAGWDAAENDDRGMAIAHTFHMLMQFDSNSPFILRLHSVASSNLLNSSDLIDKDGKVVTPEAEPKKLKEDEAAAPVAAPATPATATSAVDIAPAMKKFHNGKLIHRMKRSFKPKTLKDKTSAPKTGVIKSLV